MLPNRTKSSRGFAFLMLAILLFVAAAIGITVLADYSLKDQQRNGNEALLANVYEDWRRFWSRVDALLGYDYGFLGDPPDNQNRIGDGLSAMRWVGLLADAGFRSIDILLRDGEKVVLASVKP